MKKRIKNKSKKLGFPGKQLIITMNKRRDNYYDIVLVMKKSKPTSRLCRFGYYEIIRRYRESYSVLSLDFNRISDYLSKGVLLDNSFAKLLIN